MLSILTPEAEAALDKLHQGPEPSLGDAQEAGRLPSCHACNSMLEVDTAQPNDVFTCGSCGATLRVIDPETGMTGPVNDISTTAIPLSSSNAGRQKQPRLSGPRKSPTACKVCQARWMSLRPSQLAPKRGRSAPPRPLNWMVLISSKSSTAHPRPFQALRARPKSKNPCLPHQSRGGRVCIACKSSLRTHGRQGAPPQYCAINGLRWQGNKPYLLSEDVSNFEPLSSISPRRRRRPCRPSKSPAGGRGPGRSGAKRRHPRFLTPRCGFDLPGKSRHGRWHRRAQGPCPPHPIPAR